MTAILVTYTRNWKMNTEVTTVSDAFRQVMEGCAGLHYEGSEKQHKIGAECAILADLLLRKNEDYGDSTAEPPLLASKITPRESIQIRMSDKIKRLKTLLASGDEPKVKESLEDTFRDLAGYCILWITQS